MGKAAWNREQSSKGVHPSINRGCETARAEKMAPADVRSVRFALIYHITPCLISINYIAWRGNHSNVVF